jgi:hypothetical protein
MCRPSLAEKPKVGELQMDWLRSEDLKEVKVITAPNVSITLKCCAHASAIRETMCRYEDPKKVGTLLYNHWNLQDVGASPIL